MTTSTRCRACGTRHTGVVRVCAECGGERLEAWVTVEALPAREAIPEPRGRLPKGCYCGACEEMPRGLITRCPGPALAMRLRRRRDVARV